MYPLRSCMPALLAALLIPQTGLHGQDIPLADRIVVELENDSEAERATRDQLLDLLREYDVERWVWTERILIDERAIPHSHPVLTLHTRALGNPNDQLSTFLHEQFHWWGVERSEAVGDAIAEFRERFPGAPSGGREGGRDEHSTYLHLIICDLEFQAMTLLIGEDAARELLAATRHYTWIYERVLDDPGVREINRRHGFDVLEVDTRVNRH